MYLPALKGMIHDLPIPDNIRGTAGRDTVHNTCRDVFREHDLMARGLITVIVNDTEPEPSFTEACHVQWVIAACQLSAKEGCRIFVDEFSG